MSTAIASALLFAVGSTAGLAYSMRASIVPQLRTKLFQIRAGGTYKPFLCSKTVTSICNGGRSIVAEIVEGRRANGDSFTEFRGHFGPGSRERWIRLASGKEIRIVDEVKMMSSRREPVPMGWLPNVYTGCTSSIAGFTFVGWSLIGREEIGGASTFKVQRNDGTGWYATELGCLEMHREVAIPGRQGVPATTNIVDVVELQLSEPLSMWFDTAGLQEVKPSTLFIGRLRRLQSMATDGASVDAIEQKIAAVQRQLATVDEAYEVQQR